MAPIVISNEQFIKFDQIQENVFFEDMKADLFKHHQSVDNKDELFSACRTACKNLNIETEQALFAFFDMSFALEKPLHQLEGYMEQHEEFIRRFDDPERLPIELYERAD